MKRMLVLGGSSLLLILVWTWCGTASGAEASGRDPFAAPPQPGQQAVKPDERLLKLDAMFALMQSCLDRSQRMPSPYDDVFLANALCALHVATREVNQPPLAVNEAEGRCISWRTSGGSRKPPRSCPRCWARRPGSVLSIRWPADRRRSQKRGRGSSHR